VRFKFRTLWTAVAGVVLFSCKVMGASAPHVMLLIDEKSLGTIATAETEAMAVQMLLDNRLQVVDQDMVRANLKKDQQMLKSVGDNRGAAALGLQYGAEIIIVGEAVAKPSARRIAESNLRTYQAVVTLRAIRTDNSETLGSASETASIVGLDDVGGSSQALKAAGKPALEKLIPAMTAKWEAGGGAEGGNSISVTIGGIDQAWKLKAVRECLRGMTDVIANVVQRSYTAGMAVFEIESVIPSQQLSEKLVLAAPSGLKFQVLDVGSAKIQIRAVASK
jgi:hypothetical protein